MGFVGGPYRFHALVDDGVRVFVDGALIIDQWRVGQARELSADYNLIDGSHSIRLEYFEAGGDAQVSLWWEQLNAFSGLAW